MKSNVPTRWNRRCAVGRSKIANDAPRRLFELPNRTKPVIVYSPGPDVVTTRICSPTLRRWPVAVPSSTTTSCGPTGAAPPGSSVNGDRSGDQELPIVGAPPDWMTLPVVGSMICANDCTEPSANRTPGTARTDGRRRSGMGFSS